MIEPAPVPGVLHEPLVIRPTNVSLPGNSVLPAMAGCSCGAVAGFGGTRVLGRCIDPVRGRNRAATTDLAPTNCPILSTGTLLIVRSENGIVAPRTRVEMAAAFAPVERPEDALALVRALVPGLLSLPTRAESAFVVLDLPEASVTNNDGVFVVRWPWRMLCGGCSHHIVWRTFDVERDASVRERIEEQTLSVITSPGACM